MRACPVKLTEAEKKEMHKLMQMSLDELGEPTRTPPDTSPSKSAK
jgi:hypothetical protein